MTSRHWQKKHFATLTEASEAQVSFGDPENAATEAAGDPALAILEPNDAGGAAVLLGMTDRAEDGSPKQLPGWEPCSPPLGY